MTADHPGDHTAARVVVLAGPSGAGKSRLAQRLHAAHGWPIVRLDDFYRDEDDPAMPRSAELGIVDWDHPDSWNRAAAVDALATLVTTGSVRTPVYDISTSRAVDSTTVEAGAARPGRSPRASSPPRSSVTCASGACSRARTACTTGRS